MTKKTGPSERDQESADALRMFVDNTSELYEYRKRLVGHTKRRVFTKRLTAIWRIYRPLFEQAVGMYRKEMGSEREADLLFTTKSIDLAAQERAADDVYDILIGAWDGKEGVPMLNPDGSLHELADRSFVVEDGEWEIRTPTRSVVPFQNEAQARAYIASRSFMKDEDWTDAQVVKLTRTEEAGS